MDTLIKSHIAVSAVAENKKTKTTSLLSSFFAELEQMRFGFVGLIATVVVALGGIAAAYAVQGSSAELMAVAASTVLVETLIIAVAPMRLIFWASVAAILVDLFIFIF